MLERDLERLMIGLHFWKDLLVSLIAASGVVVVATIVGPETDRAQDLIAIPVGKQAKASDILRKS